jgi:hypothetical protein
MKIEGEDEGTEEGVSQARWSIGFKPGWQESGRGGCATWVLSMDRQRSGKGEWGRTGVGRGPSEGRVKVGRGRARASEDKQVWEKSPKQGRVEVGRGRTGASGDEQGRAQVRIRAE